MTLAQGQAQPEAFGLAVALHEGHEQQVVGVVGQAGAAILNDELHLVGRLRDAKQYMLAAGVLGGIVEYLPDGTHEIEVVGLQMGVVGYLGLEMDLHVKELLLDKLNTVVGQLVAIDGVALLIHRAVVGAGVGTVEEHEQHTDKIGGVVAHLIRDVGQLRLGNGGTLTQFDDTLLNDADGALDLIEHMGDKLVLALDGCLCLLHLVSLLHIVLADLLYGVLDTLHLSLDGLLHGDKAVLQLRNGIVAVGEGDGLVIVTVGNLPGHGL